MGITERGRDRGKQFRLWLRGPYVKTLEPALELGVRNRRYLLLLY